MYNPVCKFCPNCSYDPQTKCLIYQKELKLYLQAKPKKQTRKKKAKSFDKERLRKWSNAVRKRDGYICTICEIDDGREVQAHHKLSKSKHPELAYDINNGATVCVGCHGWVHGVDFNGDWKSQQMLHDTMDDDYAYYSERSELEELV